MDNEFKKKFKYYCRRAGFKQTDLARELYVDTSTISKWVNGENVFLKDALTRVCELLELSDGEREELFALAESLAEQIRLKRGNSQVEDAKALLLNSQVGEALELASPDADQQHELPTHPGAEAANVTAANRRLRMLVVLPVPVANGSGDGPPDGGPLDSWSEWQRLRQAIEPSRGVLVGTAAPWAVIRLVPPTVEQLHNALALPYPGYQVVHIYCHDSTSGIWMEDLLGREQQLPYVQLIEMLRGTAVQLVVLNTGTAFEIDKALVDQAGIPCVIAFQQPLNRRNASLVSEKFYRRLALGSAVGEALDEVRRAIREQSKTGDAYAFDDSPQQAQNLILIGNEQLRFEVAESAKSEHLFVLDPTPHFGLPLNLLTGFVGRNAELLRLAEWFAYDNSCVFAITGIGGLGKTSLATNAALRNAHRFGIVVFASAHETRDFSPRVVLQKLNSALHLVSTPDESDDPIGALGRRLNHHAVLLILDNLESLASEMTREFAQVLQSLDPRGSSRVLMTLRPQEKGRLVTLAKGNRIVLPALSHNDALRYAWEETARQRVEIGQKLNGWLLTTDTAELEVVAFEANLEGLAVEEIAVLSELVNLTFHHPMFIRLAVAALGQYDWPKTRQRLFHLRGKDIEDALREYIGLVLDDLLQRTPESMGVLHAMVVFAGGAEVHRLASVVLGKEIAEGGIELIDFEDEYLDPIVKTNLLRRDGRRYELDPPVRAYLEHKRPLDEVLRAIYELRHAEAHLAVIADYDKAIEEGRMTYTAPLEWSNVAAALKWLEGANSTEEKVTRLMLAYAHHMSRVFVYNYDPHWLTWMEVVQTVASGPGDLRAQAEISLTIGRIQSFHDLYEKALESFNATLAICRTIGERQIEADALQGIGEVHRQNYKEIDSAFSAYGAARALYRELGDRIGEASTLWSIGLINQAMDRYETALGNYEEARALYKGRNDLAGEADALSCIGDVQRSLRQFDAALNNCSRAVTLYQAVGDRLGEAETHFSLGDVYVGRGELDAAVASYELSLKMHREIGMDCATAHLGIGTVQRLRGEYATALVTFGVALKICRKEEDVITEANVSWSIGEVYRLQREYATASAQYATALRLYRAVRSRSGEAKALASQGQLALMTENDDKAERLLTQALDLYRAIDDHAGVAEAVGAYGWTLLAMDRSERAQSYLQRAADLFNKLGWPAEATRHRMETSPD